MFEGLLPVSEAKVRVVGISQLLLLAVEGRVLCERSGGLGPEHHLWTIKVSWHRTAIQISSRQHSLVNIVILNKKYFNNLNLNR